MKDFKAQLQKTVESLGTRRVDRRLVITLGLVGIVLIVASIWLVIVDISRYAIASEAESEGQTAIDGMTEITGTLHGLLVDPEVNRRALSTLQQPENLPDLEQFMRGRVAEAGRIEVIDGNLDAFNAPARPNGFALLEMLLMAAEGLTAPLQIHGSLNPPQLVGISAVRSEDQIVGYVVLEVDPEYVLGRFQPDISSSSYLAITQNNGRQPATTLKQIGTPVQAGLVPQRLLVPGTLFRIELPPVMLAEYLPVSTLIVILVMGALMLVASVILFRQSQKWEREELMRKLEVAERMAAREAEEDIEEEAPAPLVAEPALSSALVREQLAGEMSAREAEKTSREPEPPPMRLRYNLSERLRMKIAGGEPVGLTAGIFRAYDIRGIVGKTLDSGVARQVGHVLGTMALEKNAGPVVVARDGRLSGPDLTAGMIEGITASGCNVLDIGMVPTGVLYFAAHELAKGSGVMITGSHNPPDYNGFKIMLAGETLFGPQIRGIYERIIEGRVRQGTGSVERQNVVPKYRERVARNIKLDKPLRIVIDCGNGVGGVCAADTLRDIGAEVLPLFDEVDGTFPNHHPDPSDPENLRDLIESVRLMDADLGLALDGDADRLGVVTLGGSIIYPDRIMMLLAMDVLDRVPGATIIYDVKCTGHLAKVIAGAGGKPMMYKTGHSLIKAKMKEIGSPFAGEMSGHFFFGERWYGVDDGIYAAARLLEILAGAEAPPEAILNALPTSFSTPELKVQMNEGENHAFIDQFQARAKFDGAKVTTIDGLRADWEDGWGLVRASNTTPILILRFDAETEQGLERIKNLFRARMLLVNPDLALPF